MDSPLPAPASKRLQKPARLTFATCTEILFDSAFEAVILAFLVQIVGSVVVGAVGGIWQDMTPSLPPTFQAHKPALGGDSPSVLATFFCAHWFALIVGILFIGKAAGQFVGYSRNQEHRKAAAWLKRGYRRVSEQWINLVVVNAFTAFIAVLVLELVQQFSLAHLLWSLAAHLVNPVINALASALPGHGLMDTLGDLVSWYNANQFKFTFWLFYSAAICDDLGLPNYKTLSRFIWRRLVRGKAEKPSPAVENQTPPINTDSHG